MPTFDDFAELRLRVGTITRAEPNEAARYPAYKLWIDFGTETKQSSAKITDLYTADDLIGRQVVAVTGFEPKRVAGFRSDVLVLGVDTADGVVLLEVERRVLPGSEVS